MKEKIYILVVVLFSGLMFFLVSNRGCGCADQTRSRDAARKAHLTQIQERLINYSIFNNKVPVFDNFTGTDQLSGYLTSAYLKVMPQDPKANQKYHYKSVNDTGFVLAAEMETTKYSCNLIASNLDEVNQRLSDKSISEIQALLSSYDKKNDKKCFYVLAN